MPTLTVFKGGTLTVTKDQSKLHNGHRERMRERVQNGGISTLADHELLEMLLYYTQPRRDTNETAHALIEECGSLSDVLEAPAERLCRAPLIGENSALYLNLLGELSRRYAMSKFREKKDSMQVSKKPPLQTNYNLLWRCIRADSNSR